MTSTPTPKNIDQFSYMWEKEKGLYGIHESHGFPILYCLETLGPIVADDLGDCYLEVLGRMKEAGVRILTRQDLEEFARRTEERIAKMFPDDGKPRKARVKGK